MVIFMYSISFFLFLQDALNTLGDQGLERTLDDSAIRRVLIPDMFLLADAILTTLQVLPHFIFTSPISSVYVIILFLFLQVNFIF